MHPTELDINEYVDASLSPSALAAIGDHVERCTTCRALVADLREIRRASGALESIEPPAPAWPRIEQAIRQSSVVSRQSSVGHRRLSSADRRFTTVWITAAAATVILAAGLTLRMSYFSQREPAAADGAPTAQSIEAELRQAEQHYQKAISGLEQIANSEKGALDPATANTLQQGLAVVDQAINESRAALRAQPDSEPAQHSLLDSFKAKISLLQDTVALINEMRKGNEAGAARIVSELKRP